MSCPGDTIQMICLIIEQSWYLGYKLNDEQNVYESFEFCTTRTMKISWVTQLGSRIWLISPNGREFCGHETVIFEILLFCLVRSRSRFPSPVSWDNSRLKWNYCKKGSTAESLCDQNVLKMFLWPKPEETRSRNHLYNDFMCHYWPVRTFCRTLTLHKISRDTQTPFESEKRNYCIYPWFQIRSRAQPREMPCSISPVVALLRCFKHKGYNQPPEFPTEHHSTASVLWPKWRKTRLDCCLDPSGSHSSCYEQISAWTSGDLLGQWHFGAGWPFQALCRLSAYTSTI